MSHRPLLALIDDDAAVREALGELLTAVDYDCLVYTSAEAFLAQFEHGKFDCVITDFRLPGIDGLKLHGALTARGETMPFILITSHLGPYLTERALRARVHAILIKPISAADLVDRIKAGLDAHASATQRPEDNA